MADGSNLVATIRSVTEPQPEIPLFHDGDFHDPARLPGRALHGLALVTQLRLPAALPLLRSEVRQPPAPHSGIAV